MSVKVGINGFGRIGRVCIRVMSARPDDFDIRAINLRNADIPHMVYLLKYDSVFGRFNGTVEAGDNTLIINGKPITVFSYDDPGQIPWSSEGAEYIIESTGVFNTTEKAKAHMKGGAKKVVLTGPPKDKETPTYVMGVNHMKYDPAHDIVSNASCTTNCIAPIVKVINDNFGLVEGLMSTIHASTSKQHTVDSRVSKDWRIGRSVYDNIIPTSTGAAKSCALVIPEVAGKMTGMAFRVPAADVSVVDLTCKLAKETSYEEICAAIKAAAEGPMKGILEYCDDPIVSADVKGNTNTSIFDARGGLQLNSTFYKLIGWYDNECGYSNKVVELLKHIHDTCEG